MNQHHGDECELGILNLYNTWLLTVTIDKIWCMCATFLFGFLMDKQARGSIHFQRHWAPMWSQPALATTISLYIVGVLRSQLFLTCPHHRSSSTLDKKATILREHLDTVWWMFLYKFKSETRLASPTWSSPGTSAFPRLLANWTEITSHTFPPCCCRCSGFLFSKEKWPSLWKDSGTLFRRRSPKHRFLGRSHHQSIPQWVIVTITEEAEKLGYKFKTFCLQ